ncbi:PepSY domain-containing protein [Cytobacillus sp. FJAT-54145]|uniref:PepSY domain-containing protein n=1 Tax=Cytobacillus spartinae TaxID=3299023 RepID=A0ABW6KKW9_9BACI
MNWKSFLYGLGIGLVSGYATKEILTRKTFVSPEKALANAKNTFKELGSISGSWIHMKPEVFEKQHITYNVYKGGISRFVEEVLEQYEFVADAETGTILDVYKI